jgi:hypothetical protein
MEREKVKTSQRGERKTIDIGNSCDNGCGKILARLNDWAIIRLKSGEKVCSECAIKLSKYECSNCKTIFELKDYCSTSKSDYEGAKIKALDAKKSCEASHRQRIFFSNKDYEGDWKTLLGLNHNKFYSGESLNRIRKEFIKSLQKRVSKLGMKKSFDFKKNHQELTLEEVIQIKERIERLEAEKLTAEVEQK